MRPPVRGHQWGDDGAFISRVLVATFETMESQGDAVMKPFLQVRTFSKQESYIINRASNLIPFVRVCCLRMCFELMGCS